MGILIRLGISALAVWIATLVIPGISLGGDSIGIKVLTVVVVAVVFGVVNAVLRPIIKTVGCMFYVFTLGLAAIVVNALLFWLTGWIANLLDLPFEVANFWPAAVLGALFVGVVSWLLNMLVRDRD